jgi:hypothetical protein
MEPNSWQSFDETVLDLKSRLKRLKEAFVKMKADKIEVIPAEIKEEVTKLYDEHGGVDILIKVTNLGFNTIRRWHKAYKQDPEYFLKAKSNPRRKSKDFVCRVLNQVDGKLQPQKLKSKIQPFRGVNDIEEVKSLLPVEVQVKCNEVKRLMTSKKSQGGTGIDNEVKKMVAELILEAGHARPIALLTGLNERVISAWKPLS